MTTSSEAPPPPDFSWRRVFGLLALPALILLLVRAMTRFHAQAAELPADAVWPLTDAIVHCHREALRQAGQPGADEVPWNTLRQSFVVRSVNARRAETSLRLRVRIASRAGLAAYPAQRFYFDAVPLENGDWSVQPSSSVLRYWIP